MFTGIIENTAQVIAISKEQNNLTFTLKSNLAGEFKVDQSLSHNGVCLTVTSINLKESTYQVTAINETLERSNLSELKINDLVNIERCMRVDSMLDGHIVQGHVDTTAICHQIEDNKGSWKYYFTYNNVNKQGYVTVEKGSVTVNGVSLTVIDSGTHSFSVAIIPYTYEHTNFKTLQVGNKVNVEFDIIGKYIAKLLVTSNKL